MFEKLENWIRATTKHIDKLGSLWYNQKFEMVEDTDFLD